MTTPPRRAERGFALLAVLWFLVLTAAIGTFLLAHARSETALARNVRTAANAEALADAGIAEAVFNRTDPKIANRWPMDGSTHVLMSNAGRMTIRLYDETAKINPNRASDGLLTGLLLGLGADVARARRLGAAMADWVSEGDQARPLGAKLQQYRAAGKTYGPPNAPVESLDDLNLVLEMTPDLLVRLRPYLTLYTDSETPQAAILDPVVQRAAAYQARAEAAEELSEDPDAPPPPITTPQRPAAKADGEILSIEVIAETPDGGVFARHAVVRIDAAQPKGYAVLDWARGTIAQ